MIGTNLLIVGGSRAERERAAVAEEHTVAAHAAAIVSLDSTWLAFIRPSRALLPDSNPRLIRIREIHDAFPNAQSSGTRLILTQSTYLLQKWLDVMGPGDVIGFGTLCANGTQRLRRRQSGG